MGLVTLNHLVKQYTIHCDIHTYTTSIEPLLEQRRIRYVTEQDSGSTEARMFSSSS